MNPFKSSLFILYQFTPLNNGLKITPIHWYRYILPLSLWVFLGLLITIIVSEVIGDPKIGAYFMIPSGIVFMYGSFRINFDFRWTYGAQAVNSVTFSDGIATIELLGHQEGSIHFIRTLFDIPQRNIVDILHLPISSIIEYNIAEEVVHDEEYYSLIASFAVEDDDNELSRVDVPISPRLRKLKDIQDYAVIVADYI